MKTVFKGLGLLLGLALVGVLCFLWWASGGQTNTDPVSTPEPLTIQGAGPSASAAPETLTVMAFNIGYGRGPAGDYAGPWTEAHIRAHLDRIADQIAASGADVVALQEVDLASARSHAIHEGRYLAERLRFHASCAVTWENNYVPFPYWPPSKHYGAMKSGQCVLSRWPIASATRYRLPQPPSNAWWRNAFYLDRAIHRVDIAVAAGQPLTVYNVHLEAFDALNRMDQALTLRDFVAEDRAPRVIVLGDFNALRPDAPRVTGFEDEPDANFAGDTTIATMLGTPGLSEVFDAAPAASPLAATYPAEAPTRRLDYVFAREPLSAVSAQVFSEAPASDHLPVVARVRWGDAR